MLLVIFRYVDVSWLVHMMSSSVFSRNYMWLCAAFPLFTWIQWWNSWNLSVWWCVLLSALVSSLKLFVTLTSVTIKMPNSLQTSAKISKLEDIYKAPRPHCNCLLPNARTILVPVMSLYLSLHRNSANLFTEIACIGYHKSVHPSPVFSYSSFVTTIERKYALVNASPARESEITAKNGKFCTLLALSSKGIAFLRLGMYIHHWRTHHNRKAIVSWRSFFHELIPIGVPRYIQTRTVER